MSHPVQHLDTAVYCTPAIGTRFKSEPDGQIWEVCDVNNSCIYFDVGNGIISKSVYDFDLRYYYKELKLITK